MEQRAKVILKVFAGCILLAALFLVVCDNLDYHSVSGSGNGRLGSKRNRRGAAHATELIDSEEDRCNAGLARGTRDFLACC